MLRRIIHRLHTLIERFDQPVSVPRPAELQMIWSKARLSSPPSSHVPDEYVVHLYEPGDELQFFDLMAKVGYLNWNQVEFEPYLQKLLPDGFFFLVHRQTSDMAATAMALHNPSPLHPFGGTLSCVAVDPQHQGKGLGAVVSSLVLNRLISAGYKNIYLCTDDWRLPAIKTYLKMGWEPLLFQDDMYERWRNVCAQLNWQFTPDLWSG